jgi:hypothetical protein
MKVYCCIPSEFIAGERGANLLRLSEESGAIVKLQSTEDSPIGCVHRIIMMEGDKSSLISSQRSLLLALIEWHQYQSSPEFGDRLLWLVPRYRCSRLIGRQRKCINAIMQSTGTVLKVMSNYSLDEWYVITSLYSLIIPPTISV